ncbi:MAG: hypothetical protein IJ099_04315 [Alphaproteobacteria bacterium]|nr:hypothetical protein [Alphaproteobacteria bacterium]
MRQRKAKIAWGKICFWLATAVLVGIITWINVNRFKHNIYANYEKVVDYGRVREDIIKINPVMTAIFYIGKNEEKRIYTYFEHSVNYRRSGVKMVIVPKFLTPDTVDVVEKLYAEINKHNRIGQIALVFDDEGHVQKHKTLLQNVMHTQNMEIFAIDAEHIQDEQYIEKYLQKEGGLVVVLADLTEGLSDNFLVQEAVYLAQKYGYKMSVFDAVDTKIAQAIEKDYSALLALQQGKVEEPLQVQQKHNLEQYEKRYGQLLRHWFDLNISRAVENLPPMWPLKSDETYRLYDRGILYAQAGQFEKLVNNQGIVVALVRMAQRFVHKNAATNDVHLYLLTENEKVEPQTGELDFDDGVYLRYKNHKAVVLPKQRPEDWSSLIKLLKQKAKISDYIEETDLKFYKFKAVEIDNEN